MNEKMEKQKIEEWAAGLLTVALVAEEGEEGNIYACLHHLFSAWKIFDLMKPVERKRVLSVKKMCGEMFFSKISLRERERTKEDKEKTPPTPPIKESEENQERDKRKEREKKRDLSLTLEQRRENFWEECIALKHKYPLEAIENFFFLWAEDVVGTDKMKFELERSWKTSYRLGRHCSNHLASENQSSAIKLKKAKQGETKQTEVKMSQAALTAQREAADAKREAELEKSKADAVTLDDYLKQNPNSVLAAFKTKQS